MRACYVVFSSRKMGGPCFVVVSSAGQRVRGPPCTDNFQCIPFTYDGKEWLSAEQCFQAMKFPSRPDLQETMRSVELRAGESDSSHGMRVWSMGQSAAGSVREDWNKIKVRVMYDVNLAKYLCNPSLQLELLSTGDAVIEGAPSTEWTYPQLGLQNWGYWNGLIQMHIRAVLRGREQNTSNHAEPQSAQSVTSSSAFVDLLTAYESAFASPPDRSA